MKNKMSASVAVTSVGQVTLPKVMRDALGIVDRVSVEQRGDEIVIKRQKTVDEVLDEVRAIFADEKREKFKELKGKTAGEIRQEGLKGKQWQEYTKEHYGI